MIKSSLPTAKSAERNYSFSKYHGAGNDFILIDDRASTFPLTQIPFLCHRKLGIGADGLILLNPSLSADLKMRIFNADGSEAEMCGNGLRCLIRFAQTLGIDQEHYRVETLSGIVACTPRENGVTTLFSFTLPQTLDLLGETIFFTDTGVPHAVIFLDDIARIDVKKRGSEVRFHPYFSPKGSNVTFAKPFLEKGLFQVRTYERGVEAETLACGTGAAAVAVAARKKFKWKGPLQIQPPSGDLFVVAVKERGVELTGPATFVFSGKINL